MFHEHTKQTQEESSGYSKTRDKHAADESESKKTKVAQSITWRQVAPTNQTDEKQERKVELRANSYVAIICLAKKLITYRKKQKVARAVHSYKKRNLGSKCVPIRQKNWQGWNQKGKLSYDGGCP